MRTRKRFIGRLGVVTMLAGVLVAGTYAYTAANTVPDSKAGDGTGTVTGYVVSTVHYNLNATDLSKLDSVTFTLNSAPIAGGTLKAQVDGNWYVCTNVTTDVTCPTTSPQATLLGVVSLRVVVAQ